MLRVVTITNIYLENLTERIKKFGYKELTSIKTDGCVRAIFKDIEPEDAIQIICNTGGARTVYLESPKIQKNGA